MAQLGIPPQRLICWRCGAERPVERHMLSGRSQIVETHLCYKCFKRVKADMRQYRPGKELSEAHQQAMRRRLISPAHPSDLESVD